MLFIFRDHESHQVLMYTNFLNGKQVDCGDIVLGYASQMSQKTFIDKVLLNYKNGLLMKKNM